MDQAALGKKLLAESKYEEAITEFTAALKSSPTSPDYLIQRSTAYLRAKKYDEALNDANNAVLNAQKRAKRELIVEAQFRRGCALYTLERFGDAQFVFDVVKRMNEKHKMVPTWVQKTKMALDKLDPEDERRTLTVKETPALEESTTSNDNASTESTKEATSTANGTSAATAPPQQTAPEKIRHEWYQNSENVYFTLLAKGVPKDKAQIDIQERSLSISFPLTSGSSYDFTLEPLFGNVNPEKCIVRVLPTKVEIILAKATSGQKWSALESSEPIAKTIDSTEPITSDTTNHPTAAGTSPTGPAYPTSSKSGPKNWDKITADLKAPTGDGKEKTIDDDDDYEGGDEANHFFKKLFKSSSPEVQRAMMKSYTESNGTALSTNWEEVSKAPVETSPPDGMVARKW